MTKDLQRVFVLGTGRIGTHSLAAAFSQIPNCVSTHEQFPNARRISNERWNQVDKDFSLEVRKILKSKEALPTWVDSNCLLWNFVDLIEAEVSPRYVFIVRSKSKTVESMMRTGFYNRAFPWSKRATRGFIPIDSPTYSEEDRRRNCEKAYDIRNGQIERALKNVPQERVMRVVFSEMVDCNTGIFVEIMRFVADGLGLKCPDNVKLPRRSMSRKEEEYE
jgi:hypothetical protein